MRDNNDSAAVGPDELQRNVLDTLSMISPMKVEGFRKIRIGGDGDGGYVMLDDLEEVGVCYSLGVGPDVSWDIQMAERGIKIHQYDHTVEYPPEHHPNCTHYRIGIAADDLLAPDLCRIDTLMRQNGDIDRNDLILKIDIEGHEWDALSVLTTELFGHFRQILVEFHGMRLVTIPSFRERAVDLFDKLRLTHQCIHLHGNNFGNMAIVAGVAFPDVLELTLVRKADYLFQPSDDVFPTPLDMPNNAALPDLFLGTFRFA